MTDFNPLHCQGKECKKCGGTFYYINNPSNCVQCTKRRAKEYESSEKGKKNRKATSKRYASSEKGYLVKWKAYLKSKYNLSIEDYDKLVVNQKEKCKICKSKFKLYLDHNHQTGKIRGLLCFNCNMILGLCKENIKILEKCKLYLINEENS
jgi:hypothetical protein